MRTDFLSVALTAVPLFLLWGCGGTSVLDASDAGKTTAYVSGTPGFDIECIPVQSDSLTAFDLYLSVPFPSLIFEKASGGFRARYEISVRLSDRLNATTAEEVSWAETTTVADYRTTQSFEPITLRKRLAAAPGSYRVDVTLEDVVSGKRAHTAQGVAVHDPADRRPALGRITLMTGTARGEPLPQISFFVKEPEDSLPCDVDAYNLVAGAGEEVRLSLLRVPTDTSVAEPPYWYTILPLPMGRGLIDFARADTVWSSALLVGASAPVQRLEFRIPPLRQGLYRFDARTIARGASGADTLLASSRFYSVRGPGFPRPVTYAELLGAATYLATQKEAAEFRAAKTTGEQRKEFEAFWLRCGGDDPEKAAALIKRYYARVEEANRLFTTTREGWKTDRGMLYCVLGPPSDILNHLDTQTWYFDLTGNAQDNTFMFKRIIREGNGLTVEDYVLYRLASIENFWTRMVARWRSGETM